MADANKFKKLEEIGYSIHPCCGLCRYGDFANAIALWGYCGRHTYQHGKHTEESRPLGVHRLGCCSRGFTLNKEGAAAVLQSYLDLLRAEGDFEALLTAAEAFQIDLVYSHDEDCPENCCWVASSPLLPPDFNGARMGREEALREAIKAILSYTAKA
jgi:hypothetical protein